MIKRVYRVVALICACGVVIAADNTASTGKAADPAAEKLWNEVLAATKPPSPPAEWQNQPPTKEQQEAFRKDLAVKAAAAADKALDFYTKFPDHENAHDAKVKERVMLEQAIYLGQTNLVARLQANPTLSDEEKFRGKVNEAQRRAMEKQPLGKDAVLDELEKATRELMTEYPDRDELWELILLVATNSDGDPAKQRLKAIMENAKAPEEAKAQAQAALKKLDAVGMPFEMAFTAIDGRKVDLKDLKGKVVLIDFWATWCGPCVQEVPNLVRTYEALHEKGFEIVGISFDKEQGALESFVKKHKMTWPQYFDGEGWANKFGMENNITAIPAMYLVDKKGVLRDMNARQDLEGKVKELLAEN